MQLMQSKIYVQLLTILCLSVPAMAVETFPFEIIRDEFKDDAVLDLRWLNEKEAGESGWLKVDKNGDFVNGKGKPIRVWAVNGGIERGKDSRPRWKDKNHKISRHARWLAKMGFNMTRCHAHLNPSGKQNKLDGVNMRECEWIWKTVAGMKKEGIYTTISPFWARGELQALLFFDEKVQGHYKNWLKVLFTTPRPEFGGKTLAQEPAMGIFQIQNEDSLLFWTINSLKGQNRINLAKKFGTWASNKYGDLSKAEKAWQGHTEKGDNFAQGIVDLANIWHATKGAKDENNKQTQRMTDQIAFFTELMYQFNQDIATYVREDLNCPVLINAGNWKTADNRTT